MEAFQIKSKHNGRNRLNEFLTQNFICIKFIGIGDLTNATTDEIRNKLKTCSSLVHQRSNKLGTINTFVNKMKKGDIVFVLEKAKKQEWVHIGIIGNYRYKKQFDNEIDGMCHTRDVEWINKIPRSDLSLDFQKLLNVRSTVSIYKGTIDPSTLESYINKQFNIDTKNLTNLVQMIQTETSSEHPNIKIIKTATELLKLKLES